VVPKTLLKKMAVLKLLHTRRKQWKSLRMMGSGI
jgi:hypothetical protein